MVNAVAAAGARVYAAHAGRVYALSTQLDIEQEVALDLQRLGLAADGKYLLGIGGAEKSVCVLDADSLALLHTHLFPKRPSAWSVSGDNLVVADKFGDVFCVPLLQPLDAEKRKHMQPVLGHVSMVLDVVATPGHILTSDRDEHVRVSRFPNAFVIDRFLLGARAYIAHLARAGNLLLAAGGDPFVIAWDWAAGTELARFDVAAHLELPPTAPCDVIAVAVGGDTAYVAVEGQRRVVQLSFPALEPQHVHTLPDRVNALACSSAQAYAALPRAVYKLGAEPVLRELPGAADAATQAHLKKTPRC